MTVEGGVHIAGPVLGGVGGEARRQSDVDKGEGYRSVPGARPGQPRALERDRREVQPHPLATKKRGKNQTQVS